MPVQAFRSPPSVAGASQPKPPSRWQLQLVSDAECVALQIVQRYEIVPQNFRGRSLFDAIAGSRQPGLSRIACCGHRHFCTGGNTVQEQFEHAILDAQSNSDPTQC